MQILMCRRIGRNFNSQDCQISRLWTRWLLDAMAAIAPEFAILAAVVVLLSTASAADSFYYGDFPSDFAWGTATSSYQIEGAWNEDGNVQLIIAL